MMRRMRRSGRPTTAKLDQAGKFQVREVEIWHL